MATYIVTVSDKYPAAGETPSRYEIEAKTKADAIKKARAMVRSANGGFVSRHDSPVIYTATKYE